MVDLSQQPALGYMEVVPDRTAATLLPIIQNHTLPNTTIHSDQWQAYSRVGSLTNVNTHATVNHSLHFVDPVTGVHTQNVESYWARVKSKFKKMKGCHESQLPSYLDEFMWRERYINTQSHHGSVITFSHPHVQIRIEWRHVHVKHHWGHCTAVSCALNPPTHPPTSFSSSSFPASVEAITFKRSTNILQIIYSLGTQSLTQSLIEGYRFSDQNLTIRVFNGSFITNKGLKKTYGSKHYNHMFDGHFGHAMSVT